MRLFNWTKTFEKNKIVTGKTPFFMIGPICTPHPTVLSPISGYRWCKKICPLLRSVRFLKRWAIIALFSKICCFYIYIWGSQGKWKTSGSLIFSNLSFMVTREFLSSVDRSFRFTNLSSFVIAVPILTTSTSLLLASSSSSSSSSSSEATSFRAAHYS